MSLISASERIARNGHRGGILWLTGLSGSGKSTVSVGAERLLFDRGWQCMVLDGDTLRHGVCSDLGYSPADRHENIRRIGELATVLASGGVICICALISPYRVDRGRVRELAGEAFHEVWMSADIQVCEGRDPKGLYRRGRTGQLADFTGIAAPYEPPERPELVIDTGRMTVAQSVAALTDYAVRVFASVSCEASLQRQTSS